MVMDFIYGKMEQAIKEPLLEESDKDWELWKTLKDFTFKDSLLINLLQAIAK
jgi:hypothetical protein